jgi:CubicO group peptidase (beta-lactamase class C family)
LALLDKETAADAARIAALLKFIAERTGDSEAHIADRTARCTVVLRQDGKTVTNRGFLEEAEKYFRSGGAKTGFDALSTALIVTLEH